MYSSKFDDINKISKHSRLRFCARPIERVDKIADSDEIR